MCSLEPGGEYEETIVEVAAEGGARYFTTDDGARMTEVPESYVTVRRASEIRSMHELDIEEMARLEDELDFSRPVAGHNPLDDPAWTEFLGDTAPVERVVAGVGVAADLAADAAAAPAMAAPAADDGPAPVPPAAAEEPGEPDERLGLTLPAAHDEDDDFEPADAGEPTHIGEDVEMTMESDADWTFEQFEAVVAGSAPAPTPVRAVPPTATGPVTPLAAPAPAPVPAPIAQAPAAPQAPVPAPVAAAPAAPARSPVAPVALPATPPAAQAPTAAQAAPTAASAPSAQVAPMALQIGLAQGIAFVAHRNQTDKLGAPYIDHPGRVAESFDPAVHPLETAVAWLHDVLEDTDLSAETLREAGVAPEVIEAVQVLTRTPGMPDADYYARIRVHAVARSVKLADIADNTAPWRVRKLDHETQSRLAEKYARARAALGAA
ncbi:hypothetical protein GCM10009750_12220 [Agromyces salentinus]|uniref:HD domain-containing protein n=1 Tax=Agromyces salentinus TaxID=269421 RepID=A0ABP4YWD6_9MICO